MEKIWWARASSGIHLFADAKPIPKRSAFRNRFHRLEDMARRGELSANELQLLRLVAVASSHEARLTLTTLAAFLQLPAPQRSIEYLEQEYLLRRSPDGNLIEGLHPIRSLSFLANLLLDSTLQPWAILAGQVISLIDERDSESFLLYSFSRHPNDIPTVLDATLAYRPHTWTGMVNILNALMWLGVRYYINANEQIIRQASHEFGSSVWWLVLDFDIGLVSDGEAVDFWNIPDLVDERRRALIDSLRAQQTPKEDVFIYMQTWLEAYDGDLDNPNSLQDWLGLAQCCFWIGHLQIQSSLVSHLERIEFDQLISTFSLENVGDVILGLSYGWDGFNNWIELSSIRY